MKKIILSIGLVIVLTFGLLFCFMKKIGFCCKKGVYTASSVLKLADFAKQYLASIGDLEQAEKFVVSKEKELMGYTKLPLDAKVKLDQFFADPDVRMLFVDYNKKPFIAYWALGMTSREAKSIEKYRLETDGQYTALCEKVATKYGISIGYEYKNEENRKYLSNGTVLGSADDVYIITLEKLLPNCVLKIVKRDWIDNKGLVAFPYQGISRIFYNIELNKFVQEKGLANFICTHPEFLYNIPATDAELCDNNYIVVTPKIVLPSAQENMQNIKSMINKQEVLEISAKIDALVKEMLKKGVKNQADIIKAINGADIKKDLTSVLVYTIKLLGLWDISFDNVSIVKVDGKDKILFVNKERPGLGGGAMKNFFHQSVEEIASNGTAGINSLIECLAK